MKGENAWAGVIDVPAWDRSAKPRQSGLTMVIDKGLGPYETQDLLSMCAKYIDYVKLAFGTSALYEPHALQEKIGLIRRYGVDIYPGGTLLELAVVQGSAVRFIERAAALGFTGIEVSEGTIELTPAIRKRLIREATLRGLQVISEVGKKDRSSPLNADDVVRTVEEDLANGSEVVIIEGRDSGVGVGVYDDDGKPKERLIDAILAGVSTPERLMWEAPQTGQQQYWLNRFGADVNLGNIQPPDVITLEATRRRLRGDTLRVYARQLAAPTLP